MRDVEMPARFLERIKRVPIDQHKESMNAY